MTMPNRGVAFHVHHDVLVGLCWGLAERLATIRRSKPPYEVATRERLLQTIPPKLLPAKVRKAYAAWQKAYAAWVKADAAWYEAPTAQVKADAARMKMYEALAKADAVIAAHKPEMEALHRRLCPGCPWDGETIFPKQVTP